MIGGNTGAGDTILKAGPSIVVSSTTLFGISWDHWVLILTAVYTILQIGDWVYAKVKLWRALRRGNA